jgi:hypothetical protein
MTRTGDKLLDELLIDDALGVESINEIMYGRTTCYADDDTCKKKRNRLVEWLGEEGREWVSE